MDNLTDKVKTKKINQTEQKNTKKYKWTFGILGATAILLSGYFVITDSLAPSDSKQNSKTTQGNKITVVPKEYKEYENTPLINLPLQKDQQFSFFGYTLIIGKTTPKEVIKMFDNREYEEISSGDEYSLVYDNIQNIEELSLDFKSDKLVRISVLSSSGEKMDVLTGNHIQLGQPIKDVKTVYGDKFLSSSTENRLEYVDFASKMNVIFEDVPDHKDGMIDYIFIEKYDSARPTAIDSFENDKREVEGIKAP